MNEPGDELLILDDNAADYFEDVAKMKLGKANGNIFNLRPAGEGDPLTNTPPHDGVVMVRLKKKRFLVLDYSKGMYSLNRHQDDPQSHNRLSICISPTCQKVGLPDLIYDSGDPAEGGISLYLRSGMCFTCQRNVNEKRRTQRKRKGDETGSASSNNRRRTTDTIFGSPSVSSSHQPFASVDAMMVGNVASAYLDAPVSISVHTNDENMSNAKMCIEDFGRNFEMLISLSSMINAPEPDEAIPIIPSSNESSVANKANMAIYYESAVSSLHKCLHFLEDWKRSHLGDDMRGHNSDSLNDAVATAHAAANANNPISALLGAAKVKEEDPLDVPSIHVTDAQASLYSV